MFESLTDRLSAAFRAMTGQGRLTESNIREGMNLVRQALLEADANVETTRKFVDSVQEKVLGLEVSRALNPTQQILKIVNDELIALMGPVDHSLPEKKPFATIMLCGLQGSGKTTSCGKLGKRLLAAGRKPMFVAADLQRPAAIDQLEVLGGQLGVPVFVDRESKDPVDVCRRALKEAKDKGYYVLLDAPEALSPDLAKNAAQVLGEADSPYPCDGIVFSAWLGSDILKAFLPLAKKGKSLFPLVRAANKSAAEIQDLLTGNRLVHTAAADIISRQGETVVGRCGYSQVGAVAAASAADSLRSLRAKYSRLFLLLDGFDYPNANAKNCSYAFDKLGHGAAACGGSCIAAAWQEDGEGSDYLEKAKQGAERMKKNLTRYVTVL